MRLQGHVDVISNAKITGWAIDWDQPTAILDISIILNGVEAGRCRTDIRRDGLKEALGGGASGVHEFNYDFTVPLDGRDDHHVDVVTTQDCLLVPNGRRTLYRDQNRQARLTPILLTSSGRSGTTMLMREFVTHPDIAVANAYPFEFKLASYYASAWNVLTQSTHLPTGDELDFAARSVRDLVVGRNPWNRPDLLHSMGGNHMTKVIRKTFPDRLAHLFRSTVEDGYETVAAEHGKSAHFFAEKSTLEEAVRKTCRTLFFSVKEVVVVRDPRDYICSAKKFWNLSTERILETLSAEVPILMTIFDEHRDDVLFVRYEDLVLDGADTRARLYNFIGCDSIFTPHAIAADALPEGHLTTTTPALSIGRFRRDLDLPTVSLCRDVFRAFMDRFDYRL